MRAFFHKLISLRTTFLVAFAGLATLATAETSHIGLFPGGYVDSRSCTLCHKGALRGVMDSVHYRWRTTNDRVEWPGGGEHGMIDRACGLVGSNAIVNYYEQCGRCHVGDSLPFLDPQTGDYSYDQKRNIDCLICHAAPGKYDMNNDGVREEGERADDRPLVFDPVRSRNVWYADRSLEAAESVGGAVGTESCLRCHHHGQADYEYKRGTPFEPETDVHAAAGLTCTECHLVEDHKIARGSRVTDMYAWELKGTDVNCEQCHTSAPHKNEPRLNLHTDKIGCETCHIPEVAGAKRRVWAPTFMVSEGPESDIPTLDENSGRWLPYTEYEEELVTPSYRWFNGSASMLAEPIASPGAYNMQPATRATQGAKILPFRNFISGQPMDGSGIPGMPNFNPNFTMKAALEQMAPALQMFGLMRPEGLTEPESMMLSQFPNMLIFDRADYFTNGDVEAAVSIGMAKLGGFFMGMDTSAMSREQLIGMGSQMWSGVVAGLDLPDNPYAPGYVPDQDPTTVTGSFITVSHAIKKDGALSCEDCHVPEGGRLDFDLLGYEPEHAEFLRTVLEQESPDHKYLIGDTYTGPAQCEACHPGSTAEMQGSVHYKFESELPEGYQRDETGESVGFTHSGKLWKLCGFPTSVPQFNWLGALRDLPETDHIDTPGGCAQCHVGTGVKPFTAVGQSEPQPSEATNVDCLICHAADYNRKYYIATAGGEPVLSPQGQPVVLIAPKTDGAMDWSVYTDAAASVGSTSADTCLRCHAAAGGGTYPADEHNYASFKRGSVYGPGADVHADAGLTCSDCHYGGDHRFKRPLNNDLSAHDQVVDHQMCSDCHGDAPHTIAAYNSHLDKIACTTCHATANGSATFKDFSVHVPPDPNDPLALWKVGMTFAEGTPPIDFKWFNGTVGPEIAPLGARGDGRIYPYKHIEFNQPLDVDNNPIPLRWGVFFKSGNMMGALDQGRSLYGDLWTEDIAARTGLPPTPGAFDHYGVNECGGFSISHGITKSEALTCVSCHSPAAVLDYEELGYDEETADRLRSFFPAPVKNSLWILF